jgi:hypothetical protein
VPKFLQERWAQVEEQGKHLATMRVYEQSVRLLFSRRPPRHR